VKKPCQRPSRAILAESVGQRAEDGLGGQRVFDHVGLFDVTV
jgi:hypothetical protein